MNPAFSNAKIVGSGIDPEVYLRQEPGAFFGSEQFIYHRSPLMKSFVNPWKSRFGNGNQKETDSLNWGSLHEVPFLEPEKFNDRFVVAPEFLVETILKCPGCGSVTASVTCRKCKVDRIPCEEKRDWSWRLDECKEFREKQKPKICIDKAEFDLVTQAVSILHANKTIAEILRISRKQVMVIGDYRATVQVGYVEKKIVIPCKVMIDLEPDYGDATWGDFLIDSKTTKCADPETWPKAILDFHYAEQAAMQLDMWNSSTGMERKSFGHIVQENEHPFAIPDEDFPVIQMDKGFIEYGRKRYRAALDKIAICLATGYWPSYAVGETKNKCQVVRLPDYMEEMF